MDKRDLTKAKEIKLKSPKEIDCTNCKFLCSVNFSEELRKQICRSFWQLGDYRRQKDFILMNVKSSSPKRRRPSREPAENSKVRTNSKSFYLLNKRVCQSFFLKTLGISNGPLIKAFQHKNVYTNFFDGDDRRGRHTPSNKLGDSIVRSIIEHLEQYTIRNSKNKKRMINDPEIRSLRHLYSLYKGIHGESSPSYTSFKRIFNDNLFAFPPERLRSKTVTKNVDVSGGTEVVELRDEMIIEEHLGEVKSNQDLLQPKVIVTQVPDSSKFFANSSQVYEIQFIEIPIEQDAFPR